MSLQAYKMKSLADKYYSEPEPKPAKKPKAEKKKEVKKKK